MRLISIMLALGILCILSVYIFAREKTDDAKQKRETESSRELINDRSDEVSNVRSDPSSQGEVPNQLGDLWNNQGLARSGEYVHWEVVSNGATDARVGIYNLSATIGQTSVGVSSTVSSSLRHGFWQDFLVIDSCELQAPGDINGDGQYTITDLTALVQVITTCSWPYDTPMSNGDLNGDCVINFEDVTLITSVLPGDTAVDCTCMQPELICGCCGLFTQGHTGNTNCDIEGKRNLADITRLIDFVYISKDPLCCTEEGNVDGDLAFKVNLADITRLIDHVYIAKNETSLCI